MILHPFYTFIPVILHSVVIMFVRWGCHIISMFDSSFWNVSSASITFSPKPLPPSQSPSFPSHLSYSATSQPTPGSEGADPGPSTTSQPLTSIRSTTCALKARPSTSTTGLRSRSHLWCSSHPIPTRPSTSSAATRHPQVHTHTHTLNHSSFSLMLFVALRLVDSCWWRVVSDMLVVGEPFVHDYLMIVFPCMFLLPPFSPPMLPPSLPVAEDPRLLPTGPLSYVLQSLPCLTRNTHICRHRSFHPVMQIVFTLLYFCCVEIITCHYKLTFLHLTTKCNR